MMLTRNYRTLLSRTLVTLGAIIVLSAVLVSPVSVAKALTVNPRLELTGDPGSTLRTDLKILNEERQSRTFYLRTEAFNSQDETGNPSFSLRREGLSTWIKAPTAITLGPGENLNLPIEIDIPANAEPGGHYAAIFFLTDPPTPDGEISAVAVSAKLGSLVLLRVNGDFVQDANILEFGTIGKKKFFTNLPIQFYYRFQNTGDDHLKPVGDIQISNLIGQISKILPANTVEGSVLSKSIRRFNSAWTENTGDLKQGPVIEIPKSDPLSYWDSVTYQARNFAIGRYTADLKLAFGTKELQSDSEKFTFYIIPWQLLSVVFPAVIIAMVILRLIVKRYNRYIIRKAEQRIMQKNKTGK